MGKTMTSLSAGYAVCGALKDGLGDKINGIYPLICKDKDVKYPFIVYARQDSEREATKSPYNADQDSCSIAVRVFDDNYERGLGLIEKARSILESKTIVYTDEDDPSSTLTVRCARVSSSDEDWTTDGAYMQEIVIACKIQ